MTGLGVSKWSCAGNSRCRIARQALISPATPEADSAEPQWDAQRGAYIQWDQARGSWLQFDQDDQTWKPIE